MSTTTRIYRSNIFQCFGVDFSECKINILERRQFGVMVIQFSFGCCHARYVKVSLLPNQHDSRQTMVHGKTQNPLFDETFVFDVAYREALRRTLLLKVKDFDKYKRHRVIGQVLLALSDLNIAKGVDTWRRIRPSDQVLCCLN